MNFFRLLKLAVISSLMFSLAAGAFAQRYRDETDASYQRRQVNEANQQNQRDLNQSSGSFNTPNSDALLRQYQNQWRNQVELEKANREAAARAAEAARQRAEALMAESARIGAIRSERIQFRIGSAMNSAMHYEGGGDLACLTFFSLWFPQKAEELGTWKFLGQFGPGDRLAVSMAALETAFARGSRQAPWLAASLEGEQAWGGPPGVTWWLLLKANEAPPVGKDPMEDVREIDWIFRGTINWVDAQLSATPPGVVRSTNPKEPRCDYRSAPDVENVGRQGYLSHLALAAAGHAGYLPLRKQSDWYNSGRFLPLLEKMRAIHPGWGHFFTGQWYEQLRGIRHPAAVQHYRQAIAAGGWAAHFANIALAPLDEFQREIPIIARDTASYQADPANYRNNHPFLLQRVAQYHVSDEPLDVVNPPLAKLPPAERDAAAWQLALQALRDSVETGDISAAAAKDKSRLLNFVTLKFLHLVASNRADLWPQRLVTADPDAVPSERLRQALPANAALVYEFLLQYPAGGVYENRADGRQFSDSYLDEKLAAHHAEFPVLKLLAPAPKNQQGETDVPALLELIALCQRLDLPQPKAWFDTDLAKRYDVLTLFATKRLLTYPRYHNIHGDPHCRVLNEVSNWLNQLTAYDDAAAERLRKTMEATRWSMVLTENLPLPDAGLAFGRDLLALANGQPVQATNAWPVDPFTPANVTRAAHLINASLGQLGAKSTALPDTHPSVVWVKNAGATNDPLALWVWRNRLETQRAPTATDFLKRAALAGHEPAFALFYSDLNLMAHPERETDLWQQLAAGRTNLAPRLRQRAIATCEQELPTGYDPATNFEKRLPQGDVRKVIRQLEALTAANIPCPEIAGRLLEPIPKSNPSPTLATELDQSDLPWVQDRALRTKAFTAAGQHFEQTMFHPGSTDLDLAQAAIKYLPEMNFARGGDTTYPAAETTIAEIVARWSGARDAAWTNQVADLWHVLAVQNRDRNADAASLRCFRQASAWTDSEPIWTGYFLSAVLNQSAADIRAAAPSQLRRSNEDLLNDSILLLTAVGEALVGPYGLPRDEARLKAIAQLLTETSGGVPDSLAAYAPPVKIPTVGTPEWEKTLQEHVRRLNAQTVPPHSVRFAWELARHALELSATNTANKLILPYQTLNQIATDYNHAEAKTALARVDQAGPPEQRARRTCGEYWAIEPFNGADLFLTKAKAGESWAVRALELWILWDKLPKYAVEETYLKEIPALRTTAVEQWLKAN